jgi:hypothetical protein
MVMLHSWSRNLAIVVALLLASFSAARSECRQVTPSFLDCSTAPARGEVKENDGHAARAAYDAETTRLNKLRDAKIIKENAETEKVVPDASRP